MAAALPINKTEYGWEQRQDFNWPNRYKKDVVEAVFDNPFLDLKSLLKPSNTTLISFILVGDQNAGKSTFVHLLCSSTYVEGKNNSNSKQPSVAQVETTCDVAVDGKINSKKSHRKKVHSKRSHGKGSGTQSDNSGVVGSSVIRTGFEFLALGSYLPTIYSSFNNSRWLFDKSKKQQIRDELPYINTDVARGLILISANDFRFFCREFKIPTTNSTPLPSTQQQPSIVVPDDSGYVGLQFIEMGGDHLDRLIRYKQKEEENALTETASRQSDPSAGSQPNQPESIGIKPVELNSSSSSSLQSSKFDPFLTDVLHRSDQLLNESTNVLYFINASTLIIGEQSNGPHQQKKGMDETNVSIDEDGLKLLVERLLFLATHGSKDAPLKLHIYVSRLPHSQYDNDDKEDGKDNKESKVGESGSPTGVEMNKRDEKMAQQITNQVSRVMQELKIWDEIEATNKAKQLHENLISEMPSRKNVVGGASGYGDNESGKICLDSLINEWGEKYVTDAENEVKGIERSRRFKIIKAIMYTLLSPCSTPTILDHISVINVNVTRNYEIYKQRQFFFPAKTHVDQMGISLFGIILTLARILQPDALRLPLPPN